MITKQILVLANSTKHYPRSCVVGRELVRESEGKTRWAGWVRPVSNHDEGALDFAERRLSNGRDSRPLDVIRLFLAGPENNHLQPENWLIGSGQSWVKESVFRAGVLSSLVETPDSLWFDPTQKSDRASALVLQQLPCFQSVYLIRPEGFRFQIRSRIWDGYAKKQQRGIFNYRGRHYDFAITDPLIGRNYFPDYPQTPEGVIEPADHNRILLCVSLTPPFHDLHYKVIATVLELPA